MTPFFPLSKEIDFYLKKNNKDAYHLRKENNNNSIREGIPLKIKTKHFIIMTKYLNEFI